MIIYNKLSNLFLTNRKKFKQFNDEINNQLSVYKISAQHAVYIMALDCYGEMTIKELNASVENDGAITTRIIKQLKKEGYVEKVGKTIKKYKIKLTESGRSMNKVILTAMNSARKMYLKELCQDDIVYLCNLAEKLS